MKLKEGLMIGLLLLGCPLLLVSSRWATRLECKQAVNPKAPNQILVRPTGFKSDVYGLWVLLGLAQGAGAFWLIKEARKDEGDGESPKARSLPQSPSPIAQLSQATAQQWEPQRVQAELMPIEVSAQVQPTVRQSAAQPVIPVEYRWFKDLLEYPVVLIYGAQGAGKTSFVTYLMKCKAKAGHSLKVIDPHKEYGQWEGLKVIGAGMDYQALDAEMLNFADQVKAEYTKRSEQPSYTASKSTTLCEEFTNWSDHCKRSPLFFKASLSDIRKIGKCVLYVSHGRTLATMGGSSGVAKTRDSSLLELELFAQVDPVTGKAVPTFKGTLKYPGKEPVEVAIAPWMLDQNSDFTSLVSAPARPSNPSVQVPQTATQEQVDIRARLENIVSLSDDLVPDGGNEEDDWGTNSGTKGTTDEESIPAPPMDAEKFRSSFPGTTEEALFERIKEGNKNGLSPSDIVKKCMGIGKEKYQLGKAACIYLVRKHGGIDLLINFEKWLGA